MSRIILVLLVVAIPIMAVVAFNGGSQAGMWVLVCFVFVFFLLYTIGVFLAGVLMARTLLNDGAKVAVAGGDVDARKARAYSDVLVTGFKASQQFRQPAAAPAPALPMLGAGGFTIDGLDQDYDSFEFKEEY